MTDRREIYCILRRKIRRGREWDFSLRMSIIIMLRFEILLESGDSLSNDESGLFRELESTFEK